MVIWRSNVKKRNYYEAYNERYRTVHEKGIPCFVADSSPIVSKVISDFNIHQDMKILELGCGEGRDAHALLKNGYNVLATDISTEAITYCMEHFPPFEDCFRVVDCVKDSLPQKFDFIYAIAVLHMLVLDEDRNAFYHFLHRHLTEDGIALIGTMGNGISEYQTDINTAFDLQERTYGGKCMLVAETSCRIVKNEIFKQELVQNHFDIIELDQTCIPNQFPEMMYAVVKRK